MNKELPVSQKQQEFLMYGFSCCMGKELRKEVERQLLLDLNKYVIVSGDIKFDWSESCIEGHCTNYLDGNVENFSSIKILSEHNELIVDGWMEFIFEKELNLFIVYWEFLNIYKDNVLTRLKDKCGVPLHVYEQLPGSIKKEYKKLSLMK